MYKLIIRLRSRLLVMLTHGLALPFLKVIRKPQKFPWTESELFQLPVGTLGRDLIEYLALKNLKLLPYYARHDIKHILLQYDTTDEGEVCLQSFMLGNGRISFPVLATVIYGFFTMPEHWGSFRKAFARGKKCEPLSGWKWFSILDQPTTQLQSHIPTKGRDLIHNF